MFGNQPIAQDLLLGWQQCEQWPCEIDHAGAHGWVTLHGQDAQRAVRRADRAIFRDGDMHKQYMWRGHIACADREPPVVEFGGIQDLIANDEHAFAPHHNPLIHS